MQRRIKDIMRGAIRADGFVRITHVNEDMGMIEGRQRADAHEFLCADAHAGDAWLIVKMRRGMGGHDLIPIVKTAEP